jgi:hypothetical protein
LLKKEKSQALIKEEKKQNRPDSCGEILAIVKFKKPVGGGIWGGNKSS